MAEWWTALTYAQQTFYVIAFSSTLILVLQLILNLVGLVGGESDFDGGIDHDFEVPDGADLSDLDAHSSGLGLVSIRTVIAFFVGFGWGGAAMLKLDVPLVAATVVALLIGGVFGITVFYLMKCIYGLSASGNIDYRNAVGAVGTVYLPIPPDGQGSGRIQVTVQGRLRELPAVTDGKEKLPSGAAVTVVKAIGASTMLVRKLQGSKDASS
ncbi:MAG: hypothetical protein HQ592_11560 [Planctomycetes bacterium]|nr:hypothetical protein [Planctomycetota bacterium]